MTKKYRPYFTLPELEVISIGLKTVTPVHVDLIRYLDKYISDIKSGLRQENHTLLPSMEQKLGFTEPKNDLGYSIESLIQTYNSSGFTLLNPAQIVLVQEYRYENDLMSSQEEIEYEKSMGINFSS